MESLGASSGLHLPCITQLGCWRVRREFESPDNDLSSYLPHSWLPERQMPVDHQEHHALLIQCPQKVTEAKGLPLCAECIQFHCKPDSCLQLQFYGTQHFFSRHISRKSVTSPAVHFSSLLPTSALLCSGHWLGPLQTQSTQMCLLTYSQLKTLSL